jgi:cell division transport system permease protein
VSFKLALKHLLSRPLMSIITLFAIAGALSILGAFWTVVENLERVRLQQSELSGTDQRPALTLFVDSKASDADVQLLKEKLAADVRIQDTQIVASEEALKALEQQFGQTLSKAFGQETLPLTVKIRLKNEIVNKAELMGFLNELRSLPSVLDVDDGFRLVSVNHERVSNRIFSWATTLLAIVFLIVALLVSHLIRIAFESLRPEVETLKVIGASKFWIFRPLLLEGLFFGVIGSLLSLATLAILIRTVLPKFAELLLPPHFDVTHLSFTASLSLMGISLGASLLGAFFTWPIISRPAQEV